MPTLRSETQTKPSLPTPPYNQQFIDLLDQLQSYMNKKGEGFRARAYQKAQEAINKNITAIEACALILVSWGNSIKNGTILTIPSKSQITANIAKKRTTFPIFIFIRTFSNRLKY